MSFNFLYIPIGVPTFHLESAQIQFDKSIKLLKEVSKDGIYPDEMLLSLDKLHAFMDGKNPDYVVVQNITFANGAYMSEIMRTFNCPVLLWTLKEPVIDGGRLRLNSLTGAYSAANVMAAFSRPFEYVFGSPDDKEVKDKVKAAINAARLKKALRELNILQIGHTPQGFGFGRAMDAEVMTKFGSNLLSIEARELIDAAKSYTDEEVKEFLSDANKRIVGLDKIDSKNVSDFARLYKSYYDYVKKNNIGALSSRCWPDFFTAFGTPVCAVLAILNDLNVPSSCEADTFGALSMFMGQFLTESPTFFGDPVSMDKDENTVTFWHCGTAACSLARNDKAQAGVHCNRKIGPTLEFGCKAQKEVTIFRVGKKADGTFRMFLATGEALDKPQQFLGTSIVIKTDNSANDLVNNSVKAGWEPHFVVAMKDIKSELKALCNMLDIVVEEY